jgi:nicotinate-nucleotide adenylyltransferase
VANYRNIGLFGGTFNPPHLGHYSLAKEAKKEFNLDKVFFIPAFIPPHKEPRNVIDASHRMEMVKLLLNGDQDMAVSDYEVKKRSVSYSIDTIKYFKSGFPGAKIQFLIGSDAFYNIDTWKGSQELLKLIDFIVFPRAGFTKDMIVKKFGKMTNIVFWAHTGLIHISSTDIRFRIKSGEDCTGELGKKITDYINKNELYR